MKAFCPHGRRWFRKCPLCGEFDYLTTVEFELLLLAIEKACKRAVL